MKKLIVWLLYIAFSILKLKSQSFTFTINNQTGSYSLTCAQPSITMFVSSNASNSLQCNWYTMSNTLTGNPQSLTTPGGYTVEVTDWITNSVSAQTFTIGQNFTVPTSTVSPTSQVISCAGSSGATFTATAISPTANFIHEWYLPGNFPNGPVSHTSSAVNSIFSSFGIAGTYTHVVRDLMNGCAATKTTQVSTTGGFPAFQTSSTTNYSLGCSPLNQNTVCIINVSANGPVQFAFLAPGSPSTLPLPSAAFSVISCSAITTPGSWTLVTQDVTNSCQAALSIVISQNTVPPILFSSMTTQTLTCNNPTILATGSSTTQNAVMSWIVPSTPSVVSSPTLLIGTPNGPPTSSTSLTYANYTVVATNTVNACKSTSIITISQNFKQPIPGLALGNPSVITCAGIPVVISYTGSGGGSGIPGAVAIAESWMAPPPQVSLSATSTFTAYIPGIYTLTVKDSKNGCKEVKTIMVGDMTTPPASAASYSNTCGGTMTVTPTFTTNTSNLSFLWTAVSSGTIIGANNTMSVTVVGFGEYVLTITNNSTQCYREDTVKVYSCPGIRKNIIPNVNITIFPNPSSGNLVVTLEELLKETRLNVFDLQGKLIYSESLNAKTNRINLNLEKGFYTAKISSEGRILKTEKLLIE